MAYSDLSIDDYIVSFFFGGGGLEVRLTSKSYRFGKAMSRSDCVLKTPRNDTMQQVLEQRTDIFSKTHES